MSIVIYGIDMPKGNSAKNLLIYSDGRVFTGYKDDINYFAEELQEAQQERPKGHWIFDFAHNEMTCSECGRTFTGGFDLENADNFCRHCRSDNRGEQDEDE